MASAAPYKEKISGWLSRYWFDLVDSGKKTMEVRAKKDGWNAIKEGDVVRFHNENDSIYVQVISVEERPTLNDAWKKYGKFLIPPQVWLDRKLDATLERANAICDELVPKVDANYYGVMIIRFKKL